MFAFTNKDIYSDGFLWQHINNITNGNMDRRYNWADNYGNRHTSQWQPGMQPNLSSDRDSPWQRISN